MDKKFIKGFFTGCLTSIFIVVLLVFCAIKLVLAIITTPQPRYTEPKDYQIIKEKITRQDKITHFPKVIPPNVMNVELFGYSSMPFSGEAIMLSFNTDKEYIDNELKKYDFINKNDKLGQEQKLYHVYKMNENFNEKDYTYYVINDKENRQIPKLFPYFSGIGVNKKKSKILYYYMMYGD